MTNINIPLFPTDDDLDDLEAMFDEITAELELDKNTANMPWRDAYEQNKTRDNCILCGNETQDKAILSSVVKFCPCIDKLAKGK